MGTWRTSTPTAFAVEGMVQFVEAQRQQNPGKYAIVLVTDGYPEGCGRGGFPGGTMQGDNSLEAVVQQVEAARAANISTFVIGVDSPPGPGAPPSLTNLHEIAAAGGTGEASMLNTGDPAQTAAAFKTAIEKIRGAAVSCTIPIPPPPDGSFFDRTRINVLVDLGEGDVRVGKVADPSACDDRGGWHYDDELDPTSVILCPATCEALQAAPGETRRVDVQFGCQTIPI